MSGNCECIHALRYVFQTRPQTTCRPRVALSPRKDIAAVVRSRNVKATIAHSARAAAVARSILTPAGTTTRGLVPDPMVAESALLPPLQRKRNAEANLVSGGALLLRPAASLRAVITLHSRPIVPEPAALVTRNVFSELHVNPAGHILPTFQYSIRKQPVIAGSEQQVDIELIRTVGCRVDTLPCESTIAGPMHFQREMRVEIKAESKVTPRASTVFNFTFAFKQGSGIGRAQTLPIRTRPVMRSGVASLRPQLSVDYALKPCLYARTRILAPLTGPGGNLTVITNKKRLRVIPAIHPDSKGLDAYGNPKPKKYFWRLVATPERMPACPCEFIHVGYYDIREGVWAVNQERPVVLMVPDTELVPRKFGFPPEPEIYPQFNEHGDPRVVMVKNLIYPIHPPRAQVRSYYKGDPPKLEEKVVIDTEFIRIVIVHEGCGGAFFLINVECE